MHWQLEISNIIETPQGKEMDLVHFLKGENKVKGNTITKVAGSVEKQNPPNLSVSGYACFLFLLGVLIYKAPSLKSRHHPGDNAWKSFLSELPKVLFCQLSILLFASRHWCVLNVCACVCPCPVFLDGERHLKILFLLKCDPDSKSPCAPSTTKLVCLLVGWLVGFWN